MAIWSSFHPICDKRYQSSNRSVHTAQFIVKSKFRCKKWKPKRIQHTQVCESCVRSSCYRRESLYQVVHSLSRNETACWFKKPLIVNPFECDVITKFIKSSTPWVEMRLCVDLRRRPRKLIMNPCESDHKVVTQTITWVLSFLLKADNHMMWSQSFQAVHSLSRNETRVTVFI